MKKKRKELFAELVNEIREEFSQKKLIWQRIKEIVEKLIDKEYLARDPSDVNTLLYQT